MDYTQLIFIIISSLFSSILTALILFRVLNSSISHSVGNMENSAKSVEKSSSLLSNQLNQIDRSVSENLNDLKSYQTELKDHQTDTYKLIDNFTKQITLKPTSTGRVGEGIVKWAIGMLPDDWWQEQADIDGGRIDFLIHLSDQYDLYLDSKFSIDEEFDLNDGIAFLDKTQIQNINKRALKRSKELIKYNSGSNPKSVGFCLMYLPGVVYSNLNESTYRDMYQNAVIPVDTSGLLFSVLLIRRIISLFKFQNSLNEILRLREIIPQLFTDLRNLSSKSSGHAKNLKNSIDKLCQSLDNVEGKLITSIDNIDQTSKKVEIELEVDDKE